MGGGGRDGETGGTEIFLDEKRGDCNSGKPNYGVAEIEGRYVYKFQKSLIIDKGKNKKKLN
jgi:hypothetical protein